MRILTDTDTKALAFSSQRSYCQKYEHFVLTRFGYISSNVLFVKFV